MQAGFRYDVSSSVALGLETGLRYTGDLKRDHTSFKNDGGTIDSVNSGGSRWDIPLMGGVTVKF